MEQTYILKENEIKVQIDKKDNLSNVMLNNKSYDIELSHHVDNTYFLKLDGIIHQVKVYEMDGKKQVMVDGVPVILEKKGLKRAGGSAIQEGSLVSPMPGKIFKVIKHAGESVAQGETVLILEAMKMEHAIKATKDGVIKKIYFKEGELVQGGIQLVELES